MAAMFGFHGLLNITAFILVTVLIKRCTEMQRLPLMDKDDNIEATARRNSSDVLGGFEETRDSSNYDKSGDVTNTDSLPEKLYREGSSVWCWGSDHTDRMCHFSNLCYQPENDDFVFFHSPHSIISGLPSSRFDPTLLDLSSVHGHNGQYFNYIDLPVTRSSFMDIDYIESMALIFRRFNPDNLMHVIHDDLIPLFHTLHMITSNISLNGTKPFNVQLVFLGQSHHNEYSFLYDLLSSMAPIYKPDLQLKSRMTCFRNAHVGITKAVTWYQYGFHEPQGPIPGHVVSAHDVRHFTNYIINRVDVGLYYNDVPSSQQYTVVFTRKHNRLILNDLELSMAIVTHLKLKVVTIGIETHSVTEIIAILSRASVLIGMHGSLLSLTMFLPPGAVVVEIFPYAINPNHYTPYKTLAELPGMNIIYRSWRNMDALRSVGYPERSCDKGGIIHLSQEEQHRILNSREVPRHLCCYDPQWLYRIYQDTTVDVQALVSLVATARDDRYTLLHSNDLSQREIPQYHLYPGKVLDITCHNSTADLIDFDKVPSISLSWQPPWNVKYLDVRSIKYEVWIQEHSLEHYTAWIMSRTSYDFTVGLRPQTSYSVWIRCILDEDILGPFNQRHVLCST